MGANDMLDAAHPADVASKDRAIVRAAFAFVAADRAIEAANDAWDELHLHESRMRLDFAIKAERQARALLRSLCADQGAQHGEEKADG